MRRRRRLKLACKALWHRNLLGSARIFSEIKILLSNLHIRIKSEVFWRGSVAAQCLLFCECASERAHGVVSENEKDLKQ